MVYEATILLRHGDARFPPGSRVPADALPAARIERFLDKGYLSELSPPADLLYVDDDEDGDFAQPRAGDFDEDEGFDEEPEES